MNPERVIPGQVVSADDDNDAPPQPQETFLHKVASGPLGPVGPVGSGPAGQRAWTDESDTTNAEDDDATNADDDTEVITAASAADARDAEADTTYAYADTRAAAADTTYAYADTSDASIAAASTAATDTTDTDDAQADAYDAEETAAGVTVVDATTADATVFAVAETDSLVAETGPDTPPVHVPGGTAPESGEPLLGAAAALVREEWRQVQASFVDDPRASVTAAVGVVADAAARLESLLRERQRSLRGSGDGNGQADTEAMRQLMLTYRGLLTKLIS
jgi:hypothetical protein